MTKRLTLKQEKTLRRLGIRKQLKLVRIITKIYNTLCNDCRKKIIVNPNTPVKNYCKLCQGNVKDEVAKVRRLTK